MQLCSSTSDLTEKHCKYCYTLPLLIHLSSVLQSVLQSQGYCTRSLTTAEPKAMNAMRDGWGSVVAKEVYWFADNELSKDWPAMDVQAEIKRNIYSRSVSIMSSLESYWR